MTISDATPIQFWVNGIATYNESQPICGLTSVCFCQPFNCDDEITIQFSDNSNINYTLIIYNSSEEELASIPFEEVSTGIWQLTFVPSTTSPSVCETVRLGIQADEVFANGSFEDGLDNWSEVELTANGDWEAGDYLGDEAARWVSTQISYGSNGTKTINIDYLRHSFGQIESSVRTVAYSLRVGDFNNLGLSITDIELRVRYGKDGVATAEDVILSGLTENSSHSGTFETSESDFDRIEFYFRATIDVTNFAISNVEPSYYMMQFEITDLDSVELAKSDCIDLRNNHRCSKLMEYTNSSNFDGITYEISPQPTFYLRVPAQLLEDQNPQTQEDLELSNGVIVTIRQTIQEKSMFKLGFMPPYMHTKVQKVLMHDTVRVDDEQWKKRDPYEAPRIEDYPLKKGEVLLTKYNSVLKNTI